MWNMTIGQIFLYHNKGIDIKNGSNQATIDLDSENLEELKKIKAQMREEAKNKYGDIDGNTEFR